jgi:hypothetical protein
MLAATRNYRFQIRKGYSELGYVIIVSNVDRLCGVVVRVPGCKPRGPGFESSRYQIFCIAVGLEQGPLSLVSINEELLERKVSAQV